MMAMDCSPELDLTLYHSDTYFPMSIDNHSDTYFTVSIHYHLDPVYSRVSAIWTNMYFPVSQIQSQFFYLFLKDRKAR